MTQTTARTPYKNPPIEEALVEFRFVQEQTQEWDLTIPGKLHQHPSIKNTYPGKPRQQRITQATLHPGQPATVHEELRVQLVDQDAKRLISLGPGVLSINALRPYEGWERFRPRIGDALTAYADVAEAKDIVRIGVRYFNNIVIPSATKLMNISTYFKISPPMLPLPTLSQAIKAFKNQVQYVLDEDRTLIVTPTNSGAGRRRGRDLVLASHAGS